MSSLFILQNSATYSVSSPPSYVIVNKSPSTIIAENSGNLDITEDQQLQAYGGNVLIADTYPNLHSALQNEFFRSYISALNVEYQSFLNLGSQFLGNQDMSFFSGDYNQYVANFNTYMAKLNIDFPAEFANTLNWLNGNSANVDAAVAFFKRFVSGVFALRLVAGVYFGYTTLLNILGLPGSVHLASFYLTGSTINLNTGRFFRIFDTANFSTVLPPASATSYFPNSWVVLGAESINQATQNIITYDTDLTYDATPNLEYDATLLSVSPNPLIIVEPALVQVYTNTNAVGTNQSLMQTVFLDSLAQLLPEIKRANDIVKIGSQLTLVGSKDGKYNSLNSGLSYTHPNIFANFQVFAWLPLASGHPSTNPAWTNAFDVTSITIGTGGYGDNFATHIFVPNSGSTSDPTNIVPTNVEIPFFSAAISSNEIQNLGAYNLIAPSINNVNIADGTGITPQTLYIGGTTVSPTSIPPTKISMPHANISPGTVNSYIDFSFARTQVLSITAISATPFSDTLTIYGVNLAIGVAQTTDMVTLTTYILNNLTVPYWSITQLSSTSLLFTAISENSNGTNITAAFTNSVTTKTTVVSPSGFLYTTSSSNLTITVRQPNPDGDPNDTKYPLGDYKSIFRRIVVSEEKILLQDTYQSNLDIYAKVGNSNQYSIADTTSVIGNYPPTLDYSSSQDGYIPFVSSNPFTFLNLSLLDQFPELQAEASGSIPGMVINWTLDTAPLLPNNDGSAHTFTNWTSYAPWVAGGSIANITSVASSVTLNVASLVISNPTFSYSGLSMSSTGGVLLINLSINSSAMVGVSITSDSVLTSLGTQNVANNTQTILAFYLPTGTHTNTSPIITFTGINNGSAITIYSIYSGLPLYTPSSTIADQSLNFGVGTITNAVITTGPVLYALNFLGTDTASVQAPTSSSASPYTAADNLLFCTFSSIVNLTGFGTIAAKTNTSKNVGWFIEYISGNLVRVTIKYLTTAGVWTAPITSGQHHLVVTFNVNAQTVSIYIDGVASTVTPVTAPVGIFVNDTNTPFQVGGIQGVSGSYITGTMAEIRLYNEVLSATSIANMYSVIFGRLNYSLGPIFINHLAGFFVMKLQWNPNGLYQFKSYATNPLVPITIEPNMPVHQIYQVNYAANDVAITEMGLFNASGAMVAYATFPPIIYNPVKYHLSFNLCIQQ